MALQLHNATTGTLLGPALTKGGYIRMTTEIPPETDIGRIHQVGVTMKIHVDHLDGLPETLEQEAVVWKQSESRP